MLTAQTWTPPGAHATRSNRASVLYYRPGKFDCIQYSEPFQTHRLLPRSTNRDPPSKAATSDAIDRRARARASAMAPPTLVISAHADRGEGRLQLDPMSTRGRTDPLLSPGHEAEWASINREEAEQMQAINMALTPAQRLEQGQELSQQAVELLAISIRSGHVPRRVLWS